MSVADFSTIFIKSLHHDYEVTFAPSVSIFLEQILKYKSAVFVVDEEVLKLHKESLSVILEDKPVFAVPATEQTKTLDGVQKLIDWLLHNGCNRSTTIIGIGGGIIQDLVTFTSSIYYRGTDFVLVPTTLLSMCDSCIGAKCGINYGNFKNQLGVIHAPKAVYIASDFLDTLHERDIKSGYGEILKLAITGSQADLDHLISQVEKNGLRGPHLFALVERSLEIKKVVIEEDEYESDLRRILNYGHTFGHALEALTNHEIPHGLGVAWGIDVINYLCSNNDPSLLEMFERVHRFISTHLSFELSRFPTSLELVEMTKRDKKMSHGILNLAVPLRAGELAIRATQIDDQLVKQVEDYLSAHNVYASK